MEDFYLKIRDNFFSVFASFSQLFSIASAELLNYEM